MILEILITLIVLIMVTYLIIKKYNPILVLFLGGLILLLTASILGHSILSSDKTTGYPVLDVFKTIEIQFLNSLGNVGLTIMALFGYSAYMTKIGANDTTIYYMTKPLKNFRSKYFLIPIIFLLGNLLSLVVPSASSLGILLMATLFPILTSLNISPLAAGGIISTTATIIPTPLGADNIIAADTFKINIVDYVIQHATVSIPSLLFMAIAHYFWQKYLDKKESIDIEINSSKLKVNNIEKRPIIYGFLPILPLILVIIVNLCMPKLKLGLVTITFISLIISMIIDTIRTKKIDLISTSLLEFFKGMGSGVTMVITLLVAASMLVSGLKSLGIIKILMHYITNQNQAGILVPLAFSGVTGLIGLISGSGLSVFYATVNIMPDLAQAAHIPPQTISLPVQMIANLIRSVSPVSAVIVIVATTMNVSPIKLVKRTSIPILVGIISCITLTFITLI